VTGSAHLGRATINCPFLKSPLDGFGGSVFFEDGQLRIEGLDARVGKRGRIHVGGVLPVHASKRRFAVLAHSNPSSENDTVQYFPRLVNDRGEICSSCRLSGYLPCCTPGIPSSRP